MEDITNQILANTGIRPEETEELEESNDTADSVQDNHETVPQESEGQRSWRELREQAEEGKKNKKQLEEAYRLLAIMEQKIQQSDRTPVQHIPHEEDFNIDSLQDEDYSDNKSIKRLYKQQQKHYDKLKKEIEDNKKEVELARKVSYQQSVESRIRQELPDYQDVVSEENIAKLKSSKPHIFKSLGYNPDLYEQAVGAYDAIKEFGIYKQGQNKFNRDDYQFNNNMSKPRASSSIGTQKKKSPLEDVSKYNNPSSEDLKAFYEDAIKKSGRSLSYNS